MLKIALVTGCAGFIGSHLSDELLSHGYRVIGIDNLRTGTLENLSKALNHENFSFIETDITSRNLQDHVKSDIDVVFHLAAIASVAFSTKEPLTVNKTNVEGTVNVLELARLRNAKRFIFISSAAVYGNPVTLPVTESHPLNPLSPYAASKIAGEFYVQAYSDCYGLAFTILRFFNVYGPRQDDSEYSGVIAIFADRASKGQPILIEGDGLQTRSFIYVEDIVCAVRSAVERDVAIGETINLSGEGAISILELATHIQSHTTVPIEHVPPRVGDIRDSIASTEKAQHVLGFHTSTSFEEGLRKTLDWYQERS